MEKSLEIELSVAEAYSAACSILLKWSIKKYFTQKFLSAELFENAIIFPSRNMSFRLNTTVQIFINTVQPANGLNVC